MIIAVWIVHRWTDIRSTVIDSRRPCEVWTLQYNSIAWNLPYEILLIHLEKLQFKYLHGDISAVSQWAPLYHDKSKRRLLQAEKRKTVPNNGCYCRDSCRRWHIVARQGKVIPFQTMRSVKLLLAGSTGSEKIWIGMITLSSLCFFLLFVQEVRQFLRAVVSIWWNSTDRKLKPLENVWQVWV